MTISISDLRKQKISFFAVKIFNKDFPVIQKVARLFFLWLSNNSVWMLMVSITGKTQTMNLKYNEIYMNSKVILTSK